jgi:methylglutaconyl-CoA hydratase
VANVRVERDGDVLRITLARPDRRNAFDAQLIGELAEAFVDLGRARAVVLAGEGASFCAGADVEWMRASVGLSLEENVADANAMRQMFEAIDLCPAPVVARVQGHAIGGGAGLVAVADVPICAPDAIFAFSEVKLGIIPAVISPFAVTKIGPGAARRYFVTGDRFDAETALRIGLVDEVSDDPDAVVDRLVGELLTSGAEAARAAKRLVLSPTEHAELATLAARMRTSAEGQEGLRAFLEKREAEGGWGVFAPKR